MTIRRIQPALLLLLGACTGSAPGKQEQAKSAAVKDDIIFSHAKHIEQDATCDACHAGVAQTQRLGQGRGPTKQSCAECHDVKDRAECKKCHARVEAAAGLSRRPPTAHLRFSHASHQQRVKDCVACHATAAVSKSLAEIDRPKMTADCLRCHNHLDDYRALRCQVCHESLSQFPIRFVSAFNHEGDFLREHGRWARGNADLCATCHGQTYCADCHGAGRAALLPGVKAPEQVDRQFIHRGDWISQHAVQSSGNPGLCTRCHSPKSCDACHRSRGVAARASATSPSGTSPHPAGWLTPGSPNSHGKEARRRIGQCAGCHDRGAGTNCISCHRSAARGGMGLNPHPPGWDRGGKDSDRVCVLCH